MKRDLQLFLEDIIDSIDLIVEYVDGITLDEFAHSQALQDSVVHRFQIIGEAANRIPKEVQEKYG